MTRENENVSVESENGTNMPESSHVSAQVSRKRKLSDQLEDEEEVKRRNVTKSETECQECHTNITQNTVNCSSELANRSENNNFPITKISNGTFDRKLRLEIKVSLVPLSPETIKKHLKKPTVDNDLSKEKIPFAIIRPSKKSGGKPFRNRKITRYFKRS